jgi:4-hydroxy-2-oxoheptanedioate aldolase
MPAASFRRVQEKHMRFRELLEADRPLFGAWCLVPGSFPIEIMGRAGFDWVCLDMQHGFIGGEVLLSMIQALDLTGTPSLVRVAQNDPAMILKALDAGANGVIVPMIDSPEDARAAVQSCRHPPLGSRSYGPTRLALANPGFAPDDANRDVACIVMIETAGAIRHLDEILSVPGVDGIYLGPRDLGLNLGLPGSITPDLPDAGPLVDRLLAACARHGVMPGMHALDAQTALRWREAGFKMINTCVDTVLLQQGAAENLRQVRGAGEPRAG